MSRNNMRDKRKLKKSRSNEQNELDKKKVIIQQRFKTSLEVGAKTSVALNKKGELNVRIFSKTHIHSLTLF